jgi:hypothetical protein
MSAWLGNLWFAEAGKNGRSRSMAGPRSTSAAPARYVDLEREARAMLARE